MEPPKPPDSLPRSLHDIWYQGYEAALVSYEESAKLRQWTLDNIYTIARRETNRIERPGHTPVTDEHYHGRWGHVLRLCEQAGCQGRGVLRDNGGPAQETGEPSPLAAVDPAGGIRTEGSTRERKTTRCPETG